MGPTPADPPSPETDERVLILAPRGRNALLLDRALTRANIRTRICCNADELCREITHPTGAVVLCEEALNRVSLDCLTGILGQQPPWSEVPLLVLTDGGGRASRGSFEIARSLGPRGNVTLLERPVRVMTLLSAVRAALRTRARQYETRDLLARERAARAEAEAANRAKDQFLATLSHELRTPLNPVLMSVSSLVNEPSFSPEIREELDLVRRSVELEARLIDDLLDLTRVARGKLELQREAVDLHALLDHAIRTCRENEVERKRLSLVSDWAAREHHVWGDPARLAQIFWNLISNAVKFTPEDGSVTVSTRDRRDGTVEVAVADTGIGIDAAAVGRIFDAFEQESRLVTRRHGGLGLGLAICKALVELHGGTITAASDGRDRGATFTVRLPVVPAPETAGSKAPRPAAGQYIGPLRILVVEDHDGTARVMQRLLRRAGHEITVADSSAAARAAIAADDFDLLISDLGLPDGSGYDVLAQARATTALPAIAISGYGMEDDIRRSRDAGFDAHLVKPIDLTRLQSAIETLFRPQPQKQ